ncbi:hypothetical protein [Chitinophaga sp.]|uniref:hypothetical protein n=1 Tax=Chitinophaga sp. TaxID=1869181 RepID=UPI0031DB22DC
MIKGINVTDKNGQINVGINVNDFINSLKELPERNGWVNILLTPLKKQHPKGYTHHIRPETKKPI